MMYMMYISCISTCVYQWSTIYTWCTINWCCLTSFTSIRF